MSNWTRVLDVHIDVNDQYCDTIQVKEYAGDTDKGLRERVVEAVGAWGHQRGCTFFNSIEYVVAGRGMYGGVRVV